MESLKQAKFDYKKICASFLKGLPERTADVIVRRFGLKGEGETLESIGKTYEITRERVRQIEREGISKIKPKVNDYPNLFAYFNELLNKLGGIKKEDSLVSLINNGKNRNEILFLLNLTSGIKRYPEDENFHSFWANNDNYIELAKKIIELSISKFEDEKKAVSLEEIFNKEKEDAIKISGNKKIDFDAFGSYIEISKKLSKNPEGNIGLANWVEINPKGIKDMAFLVLKKEGKSLHFSKVAELIQNSPYFTRKKTHIATVHNELIKDQRFVLVGRGLYALKEWGYEPGVVKDVISKVLKNAGKPLTKEEILDAVSKQRVVKANTVFLNLQNKSCFLRDSSGSYTINNA